MTENGDELFELDPLKSGLTPYIGPLKIEMDPLNLVFQTFKGSKRPLTFDAQR